MSMCMFNEKVDSLHDRNCEPSSDVASDEPLIPHHPTDFSEPLIIDCSIAMGFLSSSYSRAQEMILLYTVTSAVAFLARGGDQVLESWPGTKKEECPRRGS